MQMLKSQDILVVFKIISLKEEQFTHSKAASSILISQSEFSSSLRRLEKCGLFNTKKNSVHSLTLLNFALYGIPVVFPVQRGTNIFGMPTAWSAFPLNTVVLQSAETCVWPFANVGALRVEGTTKGVSVLPIHKSMPEAAVNDQKLYQLLTLLDAMRLGKAREKEIAFTFLKKELGDYENCRSQ
jgi:hypothetical protein